MSLNESRGSEKGGGHHQAAGGVTQDPRSQVSMDGNSSVVTSSGRKSNWEVIEHYRNSGEPASLMATTSHTGVAMIDSGAKGFESSFAQNSCTLEGDPASHDTQSTDESILRDHSNEWWNVLALCHRVFR